MKTITVKSGIGREVNPYLEKIEVYHILTESFETKTNTDWHKFESAIQSYPCFSTTGEPVEEYQGGAELVDQYYCTIHERWENFVEGSAFTPSLARQLRYETRQVWIVSEPTKSFGREPVSYDTTDYSSPPAPLLNQSASKEPLKVGEEKPKEYILCAAIHFNDNIEHEHQPINIYDGFVVTGRRHHNCYATLAAFGKTLELDERVNMLVQKTDRDRQGFITNFNRFVDRKEGYLIAQKAGQLIHNMHDKSNPILISEDLY